MTRDESTDVKRLKTLVAEFVHERKWERFHNPKDLAGAISIEAAELLELFQWVSADEASRSLENPRKLKLVKEELADVIIYSLSLANAVGIDVTDAVMEKLKRNRAKYPKDRFLGVAVQEEDRLDQEGAVGEKGGTRRLAEPRRRSRSRG